MYVDKFLNYLLEASFLPDCFVVVRALTGDFALTFFARFNTILLLRRPVLRALVLFFGLPIRILNSLS